jgi:hypothetical protein
MIRIANLLPCYDFYDSGIEAKPVGRAPPGALLFAGRQKVSKNRLLLAEGTTFLTWPISRA